MKNSWSWTKRRHSSEDDEEVEVIRTLEVKDLCSAFKRINEAIDIFSERDANTARSEEVARILLQTIKIYQQIYDEKQRMAKQSTVTRFFSVVTPSTSSTSGPATPFTSSSLK